MKKLLTLLFALFIFSTAQSEITYKSYGDGWVIPLNANQAIDVNDDGIDDFIINKLNAGLGMTSIIGTGCMASPSTTYNNLGSRELRIFQEGEVIQATNDNVSTYIDDEDGTLFKSNEGIADGWSDLEEEYIGFALFPNSNWLTMNGWMKIAIDVNNEIFIIKGIAYEEPYLLGQGGREIKAGDTGQTVAIQTVDQLNELTIAPNPANDFVQLAFDYTGEKDLNLIIQNSIGQEIYRNNTTSFGQTNLNISTTDWTTGMYIIRFETEDGIRTEKLSITR